MWVLVHENKYGTLLSTERSVNMKGNLWMEIRSEKKKGLSYAEICPIHVAS